MFHGHCILVGIFLFYILFFAAIFEGSTDRPLAYAGALSLCGRFLWLPFKLLDLPVAEPVVLVQVPAHGVKQEFLEHFFLGTVVEPAEVLVLLDVSEVPFCLDGPDPAVQDPLFALDIPMGLFFQVLPAFIDLHYLFIKNFRGGTVACICHCLSSSFGGLSISRQPLLTLYGIVWW